MRNEKGQFIKGFLPDTFNGLLKYKKENPGAFKGRKHTNESNLKNKIAHIGLMSKEKHWNWRGGKPKCLDCNKRLSSYKSKYCSKCSKKGERNYKWKGNLIFANWTELKHKIRKCFKYNDWRIKVFQRDGFKCILCNSNKMIEADHYPIQFSELLKIYLPKNLDEAINQIELWDINNGRTLCHECHKNTNNYFRYNQSK